MQMTGGQEEAVHFQFDILWIQQVKKCLSENKY